jgi:hypothetical protein
MSWDNLGMGNSCMAESLSSGYLSVKTDIVQHRMIGFTSGYWRLMTKGRELYDKININQLIFSPKISHKYQHLQKAGKPVGLLGRSRPEGAC